MATQQVMSPNDLDEFSSFIEEKKPAPKSDTMAKKGQKIKKESQEEQGTIPLSDLKAISARLLELERMERSRQATVQAKKDSSRIFKEWDISNNGVISINDAHNMINQLGIPINYNETKILISTNNKENIESLDLAAFMNLIFSNNQKLGLDNFESNR